MSKTDELRDRVTAFHAMELPGQPMMLHMGTVYLVNDLMKRIASLEAERADEFNRGVLIAVSTLINCWGHGTETAHLLAMIDAEPEMVERMGFDDYDREPLLAALQRSEAGE